MNHKNIYVFAQANPDGRYHSMSSDPDWRKNRRPETPGHGKQIINEITAALLQFCVKAA